ncbi:MAG TPA: twin-arginine translocase TatA/TatE family subunit [Candidatus Limnocylindrales bacterium]|jgi:sec-independent protein translocase protein TatA|nr:twin-arginine translocase TatA/TatE family subunit [Candidatus Limnocylindrales bacterium]
MPVPGPWELILLLVIVLIIFGPGKLPDIGNAVGKGIREFRRASSDLEDSVRGESKKPEKHDDRPPGESSDRTH